MEDAQLKQSSRAGRYLLQESMVNDNPYWIKSNSISALWYVKEKSTWMFGNIKHLGKNLGGIVSAAPAPRNPVNVIIFFSY